MSELVKSFNYEFTEEDEVKVFTFPYRINSFVIMNFGENSVYFTIDKDNDIEVQGDDTVIVPGGLGCIAEMRTHHVKMISEGDTQVYIHGTDGEYEFAR